MDIVCERCRARVPAEDIDLGTKLAKCRSCQAVFDFSSQVAGGSRMQAPASRARPEVPLPPGIKVLEDETLLETDGDYRRAPGHRGRLVLQRKWFSSELFLLVFFCVAWDGFLVFWYLNALKGPAGWSFIAILFPIAHVAVGVGLTYRTLAGFMNSTRITVTGDSLSVRHGPLPWLGNRILMTETIKQLYCERATKSSKNSLGGAYTLSAVLRDGRKVALVKSLPEHDQALYLEQRIEDQLGIADERVGGEYRE